MYKKVVSLTFIMTLLFSSFSVSAEKKEEKSWEERVIYSLMVDRFNNGDNENNMDVNLLEPLSYHGGDFQGIIDKLDYLHDMGFNAIQLSPIFDNEEDGYHGEWIIDYHKPEEHFGTIEKFQELVEEAANRDMKILVEFPVHQLGKSHPWVADKNKQEWVRTNNDGFPTPALDRPEVQEYFIDVANWWIEETGLDGFVMTNVNEAPIEFLQAFSSNVKSAHPDTFLMGTTSEATQDMNKEYLDAGFDSMTDVSLNQPFRNAFAKPGRSLQPLFDVWEQNESVYEQPGLMAAFLDNANMDRYTRDMVNENEYPGARWKLAFTYLFTQPEIPVVYYASEIAVDGGKSPENQQTMNFRTDPELIEYITKVGDIRKSQPALTKGTFEMLYEKNGMAVFKREYKDDTLVIAINNTTKDQSAVIKAEQLEDDKELRGLLNSDMVRSDNGEYKIILERESAEVYKMAEKSSYNIPFIIAMIGVFVVFIIFMYIAWKRGKKRPIK
ncbi:alpha-amylase family glycosyl hydrolase [Lederbergia lenta]|uniref:alpha-amylase family glycosyl hydrolase n=1 Tax=Lederbergia lenta TaxID=1467 RepID=UPI00203EDC8C|nr:alpha-amylase family glycosyl hydrolase [Lederbergia lenta]